MTTILYQRGDYYIVLEPTGKSQSYSIYRNGTTAAVRVATIGESFGLKRAIAECDRRANLPV